jgi:hypothetical protein
MQNKATKSRKLNVVEVEATQPVVEIQTTKVTDQINLKKILALKKKAKQGEHEYAIKQVLESELDLSQRMILNFICYELLWWRIEEPCYSCISINDVIKGLKTKKTITQKNISNLIDLGYIYLDEEFDGVLFINWDKVPYSFGLSKIYKVEEEQQVVVEVPAQTFESKIIIKSTSKEVDVEEDVPSWNPDSTDGKKSKPYQKYGKHGINQVLDGFETGCEVEFDLKGERMIGEYRHFHVNNHSPKGYVVIRYCGKIYERSVKSVTRVEKKESKKSKKTSSK